MRAAITPWTESGIETSASLSVETHSPLLRSRAPSSMSMFSISSRKKGLPSALARIRSRTSSGTLPSPSSADTSSAASSCESGVSESVVAFCLPAPQLGRRSSSSSRAVQTSST
jgi:hypothetical protein